MKKCIVYALLIISIFTGCGKSTKGDAGADGDSIVGPQGPGGATGPSGPKGDPGVDASPVTVVQLCPGTTTYPSIFVEVAFCISGNLYGTYSANGGFSTLLPPGAYSSNAIGSSCNFVVHDNCVVTF